jgi:hypothetical protein
MSDTKPTHHQPEFGSLAQLIACADKQSIVNIMNITKRQTIQKAGRRGEKLTCGIVCTSVCMIVLRKWAGTSGLLSPDASTYYTPCVSMRMTRQSFPQPDHPDPSSFLQPSFSRAVRILSCSRGRAPRPLRWQDWWRLSHVMGAQGVGKLTCWDLGRAADSVLM